jgi:acetylornithine/succinyldiaminopimelate/putrescine aminotransferase
VGVVPTRVRAEVWDAIETFFPDSYALAVLYTTGMEAVEFALRVARQFTGRRGVIGFSGSMHGKSLAAARLGWPNALVTLPDFHTVPYLRELPEDQILQHVSDLVADGSIGAVFLEPLLGSAGGHIPSRSFAEQLAELCSRHGTFLIADEIFTGFHRTGGAFLHQEWGVAPDIVLIGKAMGNGFPVSGVVVRREYPIDGSMLPGSTFAGNPLASRVVLATLRAMRSSDLPSKVRALESTIATALGDLADLDIALRGKGALWLLELPRSMDVPRLMADILRDGVLVSPTANFVRLLPAATISTDHLERACDVVVRACRSAAQLTRKRQ